MDDFKGVLTIHDRSVNVCGRMEVNDSESVPNWHGSFTSEQRADFLAEGAHSLVLSDGRAGQILFTRWKAKRGMSLWVEFVGMGLLA